MKEKLPLFVFGQGPVLSEEPLQNIRMTVIPSDDPWEIGSTWPQRYATPFDGATNRWGQEIINAGQELHRRELPKSFQIMGGQTDKTKAKAAESELLGRGIIAPFIGEANVPVIDLEKESSNTFENLVNICNQVLDQPGGPDRVDIMGSSFHLTRMKILMKLFDIPYRHVIGASDIMLYAAQTGEKIDHELINEINSRHDGNIFYHDTGLKRAVSDFNDEKSSAQKRAEEDLWTRVLLSVPEYSMPYFARIESDERLARILDNFDTLFFPATKRKQSALQKHGIELTIDTMDEIRDKLASIKRDLPDEKKRSRWIRERKRGIGQPKKIEEALQRVLYPRERQLAA